MISLGQYEYNPANVLGNGAFAIVYRGQTKTKPQQQVAIKLMLKGQNVIKSKTLLSKEILVLKISSSQVYLVMEFCNGGDLSEYLQVKSTLSEDVIRIMLVQIGSAMQAMNSAGYLHRDLKPGNILLSHCPDCGRRVTELPADMLMFKLADFGFARHLDLGVMAVTMCGSPMYMAPEVLMCRKYDTAADIWSMGVIVYQCLTGKAPFYANTPEALKNIYEKTEVLKPKIPLHTSNNLRRLLLQMLIRNPKKRIQFSMLLSHPFLTERNFESHKAHTTSSSNRPLHPHSTATAGHSGGLHQRLDIGRNSNQSGTAHHPPPPPLEPRRQTSRPFYLCRPEEDLHRNQQHPAYQNPQYLYRAANIAQAEPTDELQQEDDEMSTTVGNVTEGDYFCEGEDGDAYYFEDDLDSSALCLAPPTPPPSYPAHLRGEPAIPLRPVGDGPLAQRQRVPPLPLRQPHGAARPPIDRRMVRQPSSDDNHQQTAVDDFVIVNLDGSTETEHRPVPLPASANKPKHGQSRIGQIMANPTAYWPPSANTGPTTIAPATPSLQQPKPATAANVNQQANSGLPPSGRRGSSTSTTRLAKQTPQPANLEANDRHLPPPPPSAALPSNDDKGLDNRCRGNDNNDAGSFPLPPPPSDVTTKFDGNDADHSSNVQPLPRQKQDGPRPATCQPPPSASDVSLTEVDRRSSVPAGYLIDETATGVNFLTPEQFEELTMSPEHNEEMTKISMVLDLCELLSELADRRASVLADCTAPTSSSDDRLSSAESLPEANSPSPGKLKFASEAQRIVEQIVLYRRVLYYLEYVFAQSKSAFDQGRLKSTVTARARLADCNNLYHRCYIRIWRLARQSHHDHLIEPVGQLLVSTTANRLIFNYALDQCYAADVDEYCGDIGLALQRYKAGITLVHGLCQHAKTDGDQKLLSDCMRLLRDRYTSLVQALDASASTTSLNNRLQQLDAESAQQPQLAVNFQADNRTRFGVEGC